MSKVAVLLTPLLTSLRVENSALLWLLCSRWSPAIISSTRPSLLANNRSSGAPSLVGSLTSCVRSFSSTRAGNLLDCFLSAELCFQQTSGKLKFPTRSRTSDHETSPAAYRIFHLLLHPGWVVCNRIPPWYLPFWPFTWFLLINIQLYHYHHQALDNQNTPWHTGLPHCLSFLACPFWRVYSHPLQHSSCARWWSPCRNTSIRLPCSHASVWNLTTVKTCCSCPIQSMIDSLGVPSR